MSNQSATAELEKIKQSNQELERQMEEFMRKAAAAPVSNASYDLPGRITGPEVYRNQVPQVLPWTRASYWEEGEEGRLAKTP